MRLPDFDPAPTPGRRDPCLCGSGKRFKNCCEGVVRFDECKLLAREAREPGSLLAMSQALGAALEGRV